MARNSGQPLANSQGDTESLGLLAAPRGLYPVDKGLVGPQADASRDPNRHVILTVTLSSEED